MPGRRKLTVFLFDLFVEARALGFDVVGMILSVNGIPSSFLLTPEQLWHSGPDSLGKGSPSDLSPSLLNDLLLDKEVRFKKVLPRKYFYLDDVIQLLESQIFQCEKLCECRQKKVKMIEEGGEGQGELYAYSLGVSDKYLSLAAFVQAQVVALLLNIASLDDRLASASRVAIPFRESLGIQHAEPFCKKRKKILIS